MSSSSDPKKYEISPSIIMASPKVSKPEEEMGMSGGSLLLWGSFVGGT